MFGLVIYFLPKLADIEGMPIRGFGVMMLLGVVSGVWLAVRRARQMRVDPELILSLAAWLFIFGIVGARLFYIIQKWDEFANRHDTLIDLLIAFVNVTQGGLVVYGSLIGAAIGLLIFCYRNRLQILPLLDLIAPSMVLGLALGRVGCFLNGCCFGSVCDLPWAVHFPPKSPPYMDQVEKGLLHTHGLFFDGKQDEPPVVDDVVEGSAAWKAGMRTGDRIARINGEPVDTLTSAQRELLLAQGLERITVDVTGESAPRRWLLAPPPPRSLPVHPTQLYSTIDALIFCLLLWNWYPFRRRDGEVTALLITIYPITRFLIEGIRTDEPKNILGMTISQNISLLLLMLAAALWIYLWRSPAGTAFGKEAVLQRA
jgi:phosphatidylglycerol:prolipoprotein diacylglycerol transferase